jgi:uncharacterized MAPEG superfamily protein
MTEHLPWCVPVAFSVAFYRAGNDANGLPAKQKDADMITELTVLAWACVLAFVHIFAAVHAKTRQYGMKWNMSARDQALPDAAPVVGRLMRAQANFFETFPIAIAAVAILAISGRADAQTALGAWLWLGGRVAYLPLYAFGVSGVRSVAFLVSVAGIVMMLWPVFSG